jgi:hypothetical protein
MRHYLLVPEAQTRYWDFTPRTVSTDRSCWTCAYATGYDGVHLWCEQHRLVVTSPCAWWERGAGCDPGEHPPLGYLSPAALLRC